MVTAQSLHHRKAVVWAKAVLISLIMGIVIALFARDVGLRRLTFAFWLNWLLMLWAHGLFWAGALRFPESYFTIHPREKPLYRRSWVRWIQRMLRRVNLFNPELKSGKGKADLVRLEQAMRHAEQAHALIFLVVSAFFFYALLRGWQQAAAGYLVFNLLFNGVPILVQRYNRYRVLQLQRRCSVQNHR